MYPLYPCITTTPYTGHIQAKTALIFNQNATTLQEYTYSHKSREMLLKREIEPLHKHKIKALTDCNTQSARAYFLRISYTIPAISKAPITQVMHQPYTRYRQYNCCQGYTLIRFVPCHLLKIVLNHT